MLVLRAEHDDLRIGINLNIVSGRPVEKIIGRHRFLSPAASVVVSEPANT
jgi:hypothetical protein